MTARPALFAALGAPAVDVRYVGGVVRNWLMGRPAGDIDLASPETPEQVLERLARAGIRAIPTGLSHGTVTAVNDEGSAEITTLRRDTACDGRHAAVEFTTDWQEDSRRRDFTVNAMSLRPDGTLFDYHGGLADARGGVVRFVGDAADRIQEDYLRILRLFRFYAQIGRKPIDAATLKAVRTHAGGLAVLSAERIGQEMMKLLAAPDPAPALALMAEAGVLTRILPGANAETMPRLVEAEMRRGIAPEPLRRLALLVASESDAVQRLKLSNAEATRLALLAKGDLADLAHALYHRGADVVGDQALLAWARSGEEPRWNEVLDRADAWSEKTLPVTGADVLALSITPGPEVGKLLRAVENWWIVHNFHPDREAVLAELRRLTNTTD